MASSSEETTRLAEPTTVRQIVKQNRERDTLAPKQFQELEKRCTEFSRHFQEVENLHAERHSDLTRRLDEFTIEICFITKIYILDGKTQLEIKAFLTEFYAYSDIFQFIIISYNIGLTADSDSTHQSISFNPLFSTFTTRSFDRDTPLDTQIKRPKSIEENYVQLQEDSKPEQAKKLRNQDHKLDQQTEKLDNIESRFDKFEKIIKTLANRPDNITNNPDSKLPTSPKIHSPIVQPIVDKNNKVAPSVSGFHFQPNIKCLSFLPPFGPCQRTIPSKPLLGSNAVHNTFNYPHK
ncbi:hypothetical protein K3495_g9338 [Podosphaera aphanis]|nr:hypothetical protein K3495_g9338 [Podosphaera aphanis]